MGHTSWDHDGCGTLAKGVGIRSATDYVPRVSLAELSAIHGPRLDRRILFTAPNAGTQRTRPHHRTHEFYTPHSNIVAFISLKPARLVQPCAEPPCPELGYMLEPEKASTPPRHMPTTVAERHC